MNRLRPEPHRADLLAAGAVVLAVALVVLQARMQDAWGAGVLLAIDLVAASFVLTMGLTVDPEPRTLATEVRDPAPRPRAAVSVFLLAGFALAVDGLSDFARVLGGSSIAGSSGTAAWTSGLVAAGALVLLRLRGVAVFALLAALAVGASALSFVSWAFHPAGLDAYRWVLVVLLLGFSAGHLSLRERRPREGVLLVDAAGLAALGLGATLLLVFLNGDGGDGSYHPPPGWEAVVLAAGCGLVGFAAIEREPGPAYLGVAVLVAFSATAALPNAKPSLVGWPLFLLVLAGVVLAAGLRPSVPAPPEPPGPGGGPALPLRPQEPTS